MSWKDLIEEEPVEPPSDLEIYENNLRRKEKIGATLLAVFVFITTTLLVIFGNAIEYYFLDY